MPALDARRVDQDAHLVAVGEDPARQALDVLMHRQVGRVDGGLAAELLDGLFRLCAGVVALGMVSPSCEVSGGDVGESERGRCGNMPG